MLAWLTSPENRDTIVLVLPVLWAVVAAVIALLLYKTSESVLKGLAIPGIKGLRLAGSAAIFVVVFLLLRSSTDTASRPQGQVVAPAELTNLRELAERVENDMVELNGCVATVDAIEPCADKVQQARGDAHRLKQAIDLIRGAAQRR